MLNSQVIPRSPTLDSAFARRPWSLRTWRCAIRSVCFRDPQEDARKLTPWDRLIDLSRVWRDWRSALAIVRKWRRAPEQPKSSHATPCRLGLGSLRSYRLTCGPLDQFKDSRRACGAINGIFGLSEERFRTERRFLEIRSGRRDRRRIP